MTVLGRGDSFGTVLGVLVDMKLKKEEDTSQGAALQELAFLVGRQLLGLVMPYLRAPSFRMGTAKLATDQALGQHLDGPGLHLSKC